MARIWQLRNESWQLPERGGIMGIVNVTPDSFSDGGLHATTEAALAHARKLLEEGADILDIGGESTRPGGSPVSEAEEQARVLPVIHALNGLRAQCPTLRLSIDTRNASTARLALEAGADIVNDVTGLTAPAMRSVCAEYGCGVIIMHMLGTPFHMPDTPRCLDIVTSVRNFFEAQVAAAEQAGISPARLCLDPGIGFGKTTAHNLELIHHLAELRVRDLPLMMALSRKRFLGELIGNPAEAKSSSIPTIAMSMLAADNGADVHRVHDVAPHRTALNLRLAALQQA